MENTLFAEEMKKSIKLFKFFLWLLMSAQPSPESCLTIWSFSPSCLLTGCLIKKNCNAQQFKIWYETILPWANNMGDYTKTKLKSKSKRN